MSHIMGYLKGREKELCVALDQVHGGQQQVKRKLCSLSAVASDVCPLFFFFFLKHLGLACVFSHSLHKVMCKHVLDLWRRALFQKPDRCVLDLF